MGTPYVGLSGRLLEWVEGTTPELLSSHTKGGSYFEPVCAMDGMVHPGKGIIGLKFTNVDNAIIDSGSVKVHNLFDFTALGEEGVCITQSNTGGDPNNENKLVKEIGSQQTPYQVAFSMNQISAISIESSNVKCNENVDISVKNVKSSTGRVLGITAWYGSKVQFDVHSSVTINDLFAGNDVEQGSFGYYEIPNHSPEVCAFGAYGGKTISPVIDYVDYMDNFYNTQINVFCVHGHYGCWGSGDDADEEAQITNVGQYDKKQQCEFKKTPNMKKVQQKLLSESVYANSDSLIEGISHKHGLSWPISMIPLIIFVGTVIGLALYSFYWKAKEVELPIEGTPETMTVLSNDKPFSTKYSTF